MRSPCILFLFQRADGCAQTAEEVAPGSTIAALQQNFRALPELAAMQTDAHRRRSDYQPKSYALKKAMKCVISTGAGRVMTSGHQTTRF